MAFNVSFGAGTAVRNTLANALAVIANVSYERTIMVLTVLFCAGLAATLWHLSHLSSNLVESGALQGTSLYADSLTELRTFYGSQIVERVKPQGIEVTHDYASKQGAIPIPATFSIEFGKHISKKDSGMQVRLYKIEAEAVKVATEEVALGELLNQIKSIYAGSLDKDLTLRWDYPSELPSVATDSEKLKQILQNLIDNAIKFTDQGSITIYVGYLTDSGKVAFKVADTGIGISDEEIPFIFEKFHQVDSSATRTYGGVGLGLFIVKKFTERLGGELSVSSELGKGSTFTVTLPIEL